MRAPSRGSRASITTKSPGRTATAAIRATAPATLIKDLLRFYDPASVLDPMTRLRHLPGRLPRARDPLPTLRPEARLRRLRSRELRRAGHVRLLLDPSALLAHEALQRRPARPVHGRDARGLPRTLRRAHRQLHRVLSSPAASSPSSWATTSTARQGFVPLVYHTKRLAFAAGLRQACTDIIRFSHGASSGKKVYRTSLHPRPARRLHCLREATLTRRGPTPSRSSIGTGRRVAN